MIFKFRIVFVIIFALFFLQSFSYAQNGQRVAVLYFSDHSKFDSGSGCSWFSLGPLNSLFGIGQSREKWNLSAGFRDLLNENLKSLGYSIIEPSYVDEVIRESGRDNISGLANKLGADVVMVGDITKFEQHRTRVSSQGPTRASTGGEYSMQANFMGGLAGYYYSSSVRTVFMVYDNSGNEIGRSEIESKKDLKDFYIGIGPMSKNYKGGDATDKEKPKELQQPIVDYKKLDTMKFGTEEFRNNTLFGLATMDVVNQMVTKVSEHVEPSSQPNAIGKIIYVGDGKHLKENEVYIDLGAGDGLVIGHKLGIYIEGVILTDPDTGKELGKSPDKRLGSIKITKIEAEHLSIAEIAEGLGQIAKGNIIKAD